MAIRNLNGIKRQVGITTQEAQNARELKEENFWNRVKRIMRREDDAIDAVETIEELYSNGLGSLFEKWDKSQDIHFDTHNKSFDVSKALESTHVEYCPLQKMVYFNSNSGGMLEGYRSDKHANYLIHRRLEKYDEKLTQLAIKFEPYLDNLLKWIDSL